MKILIAGSTGQLGRATVRRVRHAGHEVIALGRDQLDICDDAMVLSRLREAAPDVVINAAAYTAVDRAESERERAFAVNAQGAEHLAHRCADQQVRLLHVSTDYVFDGTAHTPYSEDALVSPLGAYGESKLAGERAVTLHGGIVVRTSWLFEESGPSFVHTMLRLCHEREVLRVVADQHGCPTWADDLADALVRLAQVPAPASTYHFCNDGATTWHAFATAIVDEVRRYRSVRCERIDAITTAEFPTPARRPAYSVLDTTRIRAAGITPPPWHAGLAHVVAQVLRT